MSRKQMDVRMVKIDGYYYDLVYSPDDGGWYLERYSDDATSQIFASERDALTKPIVWNE